MKKIKALFNNYYFNFGLIIFFTASVLYISVKDNFAGVIKTLANINLLWFIVVLIFAFSSQVVIGWILKVLVNIKYPEYTLVQGTINSMIASLFHGITPSSSGGQFIQVYIYRKQGVKISDSISILLMDFILYQITLVTMSLFFLLTKFNYFFSNYVGTLWLVVAGFIVDSFFVLALFTLSSSPKIYTWVSHKGLDIALKLRLVKDREQSLEKINESLTNFQAAWAELKKHKMSMAKVMFLNIFRLLNYYMVPIFVFLALGIKITPSLVFDIITLSSFIHVINHLVPIPGSSGTTEATFILLFTPLVGYVNAVTSSIIWRFTTFHLMLIVGGILFIMFKRIHDKPEKGV